MSFTALYKFMTTSFGGIVDSLSSLLVSLLVTPFPTLLSDLAKTEGLAEFIKTILDSLSSLLVDVPMFNAPLLVVLLGTFLVFFVVLTVARWFFN